MEKIVVSMADGKINCYKLFVGSLAVCIESLQNPLSEPAVPKLQMHCKVVLGVHRALAKRLLAAALLL